MLRKVTRPYRFICLIIGVILLTSSISFAQFKLTVQFSGMNPHIGQKLELRVIDQANENEVGRTKLEQITNAEFSIELYALLQDHNYIIEFYADHNSSGIYDNGDHSWRLQLPNVQSDTEVSFSHNTDFTEINWPLLIDFKYYTAIWKGTRTNFTFNSGGPFEMMIDLVVEDGGIEGTVDAIDAFGIGGTTGMEFEGEFFQEADSAVISPVAGSNWTGSLFWVNSVISGALTYGLSGAKVSLSGTLGRTQAIIEYDIDIFNAEGIIVALEDSIITTIRQDSLALIALYDSTNGDNWTNNDNWKFGPVSTWHGVTVENNRVTALMLGDNNLSGTIPGAIGDLTELITLRFENNSVQGSIPGEIGSLAKLETLRLEQNNLVGEIPFTIGNLENLSVLWLYSNGLTGEIPESIGNLINVRQLRLSENNLNGALPSELWSLVNLLELWLNDNALIGTIPIEVSNLTQLKRLVLSYNNFSGTLPREIGTTNLFDLRLDNNNFEGELPAELINLKEIIYLYLNSNNFSGAVPEGISAFNQMQYCWVENNNFHDFPNLFGVTTLADLRIKNNRFTFEDIEPNIGITAFSYSPQDSVGEGGDTTIVENTPLSLRVDVGGSANEYQWFRDAIELPATNNVLTISGIKVEDSGDYSCRITNTFATELTLYSRPIHVQVNHATSVAEDIIPQRFSLYANYPNPFNPETIIRYDLAGSEHVKIEIFNLLGQKIRTLVDTQKPAGSYSVSWTGRTEQGNEAPSGTYIYRIKAGRFEQSKKLVLLR